MKVYGWVDYDSEAHLYATRELAEAAIEPRLRTIFRNYTDPTYKGDGPGGVGWRVPHYRALGWEAFWERERGSWIAEFEVEE